MLWRFLEEIPWGNGVGEGQLSRNPLGVTTMSWEITLTAAKGGQRG